MKPKKSTYKTKANRPDYGLTNKCGKLAWDGNRKLWYCSKTSICYRSPKTCALVEALAKEIKLGIRLCERIEPMSLRKDVEKELIAKQAGRQLELEFA